MLKYGYYFSTIHIWGEDSMKFLKRPIGVTVALFIAVLILQLTKLAEVAWQIGLVYIFLIVAVFMHELGHAVVGKIVGYQFHYMTFGPFTIEPRGLLWNERWMAFGGLTSCTPLTEDVEVLVKKHKLYVFGGPLFSYIGMFGSYVCAFLFDNTALNILGLLNLALLVVTVVPIKSPLRSDGYIFFQLRKGDDEAKQLVSSVLLQKRMMSPESPQNWPVHLIEEAKKVPASLDETFNSYMIFYYEIVQNGYSAASKEIEDYKKLPQEEGLKRQFITHIQQIDLLHEGEATVDNLEAFHVKMKPLEKLSYLRSEAMILSLKGEHEAAKEKLMAVQELITKGKEQYGFYEAEQLLLNEVEEALQLK